MVSFGKIALLPRWLRMPWWIDFSMISPISATLLPNFFSSSRTNLAKSSMLEWLACSRNSFWAAKRRSPTFQEGIDRACFTTWWCSAHIWGSWKGIKDWDIQRYMKLGACFKNIWITIYIKKYKPSEGIGMN